MVFGVGIGLGFVFLVILAMVWSLIWKAFALWYSAKKDDKIWFVIFLFINLLGIPEMVYLHFRTDFFKKLKLKKKLKKK